MKYMKFIMASSLALGQFCEAKQAENEFQLIVMHSTGENTLLNIDPNACFSEVMRQAEIESGEDLNQKTFILDCRNDSIKSLSVAKSTTASTRNYTVKLEVSEKEDIAYIVTNLGRSSLKKLLNLKSSLKKAGARVDHVHPFKFISCIFLDDELKVSFLQIKERGGWVGKEFFNGMYDSLTEEARLDNLEKYIADFANQLQIDSSLISKPIGEQDWKGLVNNLINALPRKGNPNRYDM